MPKEKLIQLGPGKGLDSGVYPGAERSVGAVWGDGTNAWFRELHIEHAPGRTLLVPTTGRPVKAIAQANVNGIPRVYYECLGIVRYFESTSPQVIGALSAGGSFDFEPWGTWLLATDDVNGLQIWQNDPLVALAEIPDALTQFDHCKIVRKLAQHVIAYTDDAFYWCSASNPLLWTPSANNSAGSLFLRNLDSDVMAVAQLGSAHAVYSQNNLLLVQYTGVGSWFGTPTQGLTGIGAVSKNAVVSLGRYNWGISRGGIWLTDGSTMMYVDRPAVDRWLQETVDWDRADEIAGYFNDKLYLVIWTVPVVGGGSASIAVDPKNKTSFVDTGKRTFGYLDDGLYLGDERAVFNYPITAREDGLYLESVSGTLAGGFTLSSQLFDAGAQEIFKVWDYIMLEGTISGGEIRIGFTDDPKVDPQWLDWQDVAYKVPLEGRESVFLAIQFRSEETFRLSGLTVFGEKGGFVL